MHHSWLELIKIYAEETFIIGSYLQYAWIMLMILINMCVNVKNCNLKDIEIEKCTANWLQLKDVDACNDAVKSIFIKLKRSNENINLIKFYSSVHIALRILTMLILLLMLWSCKNYGNSLRILENVQFLRKLDMGLDFWDIKGTNSSWSLILIKPQSLVHRFLILE